MSTKTSFANDASTKITTQLCFKEEWVEEKNFFGRKVKNKHLFLYQKEGESFKKIAASLRLHWTLGEKICKLFNLGKFKKIDFWQKTAQKSRLIEAHVSQSALKHFLNAIALDTDSTHLSKNIQGILNDQVSRSTDLGEKIKRIIENCFYQSHSQLNHEKQAEHFALFQKREKIKESKIHQILASDLEESERAWIHQGEHKVYDLSFHEKRKENDKRREKIFVCLKGGDVPVGSQKAKYEKISKLLRKKCGVLKNDSLEDAEKKIFKKMPSVTFKWAEFSVTPAENDDKSLTPNENDDKSLTPNENDDKSLTPNENVEESLQNANSQPSSAQEENAPTGITAES